MSDNVDTREIERFDALADHWWDPNGALKPLHDMNPVRLDYVDTRAGLDRKRVLDVGCGGGLLAEGMARRGADVLGIDLSTKPLRVAQLHALEAATPRIAYREVAVEALAAEMPAQFDVVTCMEMLEHVPDPGSVVASCARLVKPGGWAFFSTINRNAKAFAFAIVGAEHVLRLLPKGTHEYARFLRPSELAAWCRSAALDPVATRGLEYNALTRRYRLSADTSVNYLVACRKAA